MYFSVNSVKHWALLTPSGLMLYRKEGSKTKYLGRLPVAQFKEMLAKAGAEVAHKIKTELEAVKQSLESQKPTHTSQPSQPSLTWKSGNHTYWLLLYGKSIYVYMKGPTTRHRPKLVEKTDVSGVVGRVVAAGAFHVLEALRLVVNGLYAAVVDLLKPPAKPQTPAEESKKPQTPPSKPQEERVSRREAEEALRKLKSELRKAVMWWDEKWRREAREYEGPPDREWLRARVEEFVSEYMYLIEKILPYKDLVDKFAGAAAEATYEYLTRRDVLEILESKL